MCDANASGIQPKLEPWQKAKQEKWCNNFCTYLPSSLSLSYYHLTLFSHCFVSFVCWEFLKDVSALASLSYTFHRKSSSVSSPCHMLVSKTNEHVYPNAVEIFFSFSSFAVAHHSLSLVCFPSISHKSDLSKTLNTELPMFLE